MLHSHGQRQIEITLGADHPPPETIILLEIPSGFIFGIQQIIDARFERHGANLWRIERVSVADVALGTEITTPTLEGGVKVHVPSGTQPGSVLRIGGKGLPIVGQSGRGDILLRINVEVPTTLGDGERSLYEQLRKLARGKS